MNILPDSTQEWFNISSLWITFGSAFYATYLALPNNCNYLDKFTYSLYVSLIGVLMSYMSFMNGSLTREVEWLLTYNHHIPFILYSSVTIAGFYFFLGILFQILLKISNTLARGISMLFLNIVNIGLTWHLLILNIV